MIDADTSPVATQPAEALTADEHAAVDRAGELYTLLERVVGDGPTRDDDLREFRTSIHHIQRAVMAQAAARAYPTRGRLLGGTVRA